MNKIPQKGGTSVVYATMLTAYLPTLIVVGVVIGIALAALTQNPYFFTGGLFGTIFLSPIFLAKKAIKKYNGHLDAIKDELFNKLPKVDYFHTSQNGGIAICVQSKQIVLIQPLEQGKKDITVSPLDINKIINYGATSPSTTSFVSISNDAALDVVGNSKQIFDQAIAQAKKNKKTGLMFEMDNIYLPFALAPMTYEDAERWMLLIKKLMDGSLENQPSPLHYPVQQAA